MFPAGFELQPARFELQATCLKLLSFFLGFWLLASGLLHLVVPRMLHLLSRRRLSSLCFSVLTVAMMFLLSRLRWRLKTEFLVTNVTARVRDVTASAESGPSQDECA